MEYTRKVRKNTRSALCRDDVMSEVYKTKHCKMREYV